MDEENDVYIDTEKLGIQKMNLKAEYLRSISAVNGKFPLALRQPNNKWQIGLFEDDHITIVIYSRSINE